MADATGSTIEDLNPVQLDSNGHIKKAYIGCKLQESGKLREFLTANTDLFTFSHADMPEAGAFAQIREHDVIAFIWKNIICRYGLPKEISYDNGSQFAGKKVADIFEKWHIKRILSTPYHPVGNGQAESSNKSILNIMKKKLEDAKGLWPEILPEKLWAYRTTPKTSIGKTPYSLIYGTDAVILVGEPSLRYFPKSGPQNDDSRKQKLEEVGERRDMAYVRTVF
ncbi:uncharacterized protein [Nicotiana tomentosiformis]|uniref:uncharacterized protein n=1 Tax=Nicotiana tomentosiformis TaxID=4098 RepID=UPI00388CBF8C